MILGTVKGTIVSTRKFRNLVGYKLLMVEPYSYEGEKTQMLVAADSLGAGIGELVLVTTDNTTQYALERSAPIDAFIVGIVDAPPVIGK